MSLKRCIVRFIMCVMVFVQKVEFCNESKAKPEEKSTLLKVRSL